MSFVADTPTQKPFPHGEFLGLPLYLGSTQNFISQVVEQCNAWQANNREPLLIGYLNAWTTVLALQDPWLSNAFKNLFGIVYADGKGVVWGARYRGLSIPERVNAADFIREFLQECARSHLRVYLMGGEPGLAEDAMKQWTRLVPDLIICGCADGYPSCPKQRGRDIAAASPDILLLGMGTPHQERWAVDHGSDTGAKVIWCVGAMMEYHSGYRARAPRWMIGWGFEWLFRLVLEPRRLAYRYFVGNLRFVWSVLKNIQAP
jgi:N-acetylglucosaminyldiphosphoundecaprenol N-acetyl-beta-D-mannosaminyltransferase